MLSTRRVITKYNGLNTFQVSFILHTPPPHSEGCDPSSKFKTWYHSESIFRWQALGFSYHFNLFLATLYRVSFLHTPTTNDLKVGTQIVRSKWSNIWQWSDSYSWYFIRSSNCKKASHGNTCRILERTLV